MRNSSHDRKDEAERELQNCRCRVRRKSLKREWMPPRFLWDDFAPHDHPMMSRHPWERSLQELLVIFTSFKNLRLPLSFLWTSLRSSESLLFSLPETSSILFGWKMSSPKDKLLLIPMCHKKRSCERVKTSSRRIKGWKKRRGKNTGTHVVMSLSFPPLKPLLTIILTHEMQIPPSFTSGWFHMEITKSLSLSLSVSDAQRIPQGLTSIFPEASFQTERERMRGGEEWTPFGLWLFYFFQK